MNLVLNATVKLLLTVTTVKVKVSLYRPREAPRVQGS